MDRLQALEAFVAVVEAGNFSRAAEHLGWPRPTVTRLVQTLETDLATTLLHRTTRRMKLTSEGRHVLERARRLLGDYAALQNQLASERTTPRGRLRVDMSSAVANQVIIPSLPAFQTRYPQIELQLAVNNRSADLIDRKTDCVIRIGHILDEGLIARPAHDLRLLLVASPDYLSRYGTPVGPDDISRAHIQIQTVSPRTRRVIERALTKASETAVFDGYRHLSVDDANAVIMAALSGLGIARAYEFLARPHLVSGRLVSVLPDWDCGTVPIRLAYPADRKLPRRVRAFIDWAAPLIEGLGVR